MSPFQKHGIRGPEDREAPTITAPPSYDWQPYAATTHFVADFKRDASVWLGSLAKTLSALASRSLSTFKDSSGNLEITLSISIKFPYLQS